MSALRSISEALHAHDGLGYLGIIAAQYGVQPLLARGCIPPGTPTASLVLGGELAKICFCLWVLLRGGTHVFNNWTLKGSMVAAGLPSVTYLIQNYCIQIAYQNLDGVAFNVLNQTKALFTALFAFLIAGRRQSRVQCIALLLVTAAAILVSMPAGSKGGGSKQAENSALGILCALAAAVLSGLGAGITEWAMRRQQRDNYLLSLEIGVLGCCILYCNLLLGWTEESEIWWREGLFTRWRPLTLVPVLTQGFAGIIVGIVTKIAGGVRKILATICGLILTCVLQQLTEGVLPPLSVCVAVPVVAVGIYLHASYPPQAPASVRVE